jgi:hypothetical protein
MITAIASNEAMPLRRTVVAKGSGEQHWCTDFIGNHAKGESTNGLEAFLIDLSPGETIPPHFHEVDQFQIFVAGAATLGRDDVPPLTVHYVDRHTGYGPVVAGPHGSSYFTLHATRDPGAVYRHKPGYQERMKPGKHRHRLAPAIVLSTKPVLQNRGTVACESLFDATQAADGFGAILLRLGAAMKTTVPQPHATGGQFCIVVNGSLEWHGASLPKWSTIAADSADPAPELCAGPQGLEALILQFPQPDG